MTTYYRKVGARYVPVAESELMSAWTEGNYLVHVRPGGRNIYFVLPESNLQDKINEHDLKTALVESLMDRVLPDFGPQSEEIFQLLREKGLDSYHLKSRYAFAEMVAQDTITKLYKE